jgi:hypothetical protein
MSLLTTPHHGGRRRSVFVAIKPAPPVSNDCYSSNQRQVHSLLKKPTAVSIQNYTPNAYQRDWQVGRIWRLISIMIFWNN